MNRLTKISHITEKVLEKLVAVLCLILLSALFIQVVNRYILGVSTPELQFIIPFCFLWMCMAGSALAVKKNQHFEVDLIAKILPNKARNIHSIVMILFVLVAGVIIAWSAIGFVELGLLKKSPATGIKMFYIYTSLLFGGVLIVLMALEQLINAVFFIHNTPKE